jgi:hypothetical protein
MTIQAFFVIQVKSYIAGALYSILVMLYEVCVTIVTAKNSKIGNDRVVLTRSAIFLIYFLVIHTETST